MLPLSGCQKTDAPATAPGSQATATPEKLKNWAGNLEYSTSNVSYPETVEQVQALVKQAGGSFEISHDRDAAIRGASQSGIGKWKADQRGRSIRKVAAGSISSVKSRSAAASGRAG